MSYSKIQKVVQDNGIGFRTLNQLAANIQAVPDGLAVDHGTENVAANQKVNGAYTLRYLGGHPGGGVPRAVVKTLLYTPFGGGLANGVDWASNSALVTGVSRFSTGQYFVGVTGLPAFYGRAVVLQTAIATVATAQCWTYYNAAQSPTGVWVQLYANAAGAFGLVDMAFCLTIYGIAP